jgi:hypothetical protein
LCEYCGTSEFKAEKGKNVHTAFISLMFWSLNPQKEEGDEKGGKL